MSHLTEQPAISRRFMQWGISLFLLGLLTGFAMPLFANPRMGLASHLEGILNGIFLVALGLIWHKIRLSRRVTTLTFWLAIYGTFANWLATLLAAWWGAGLMMPIAANGQTGNALQEAIISNLLLSLSTAMILVCILVLYGLRHPGSTQETPVSDYYQQVTG